MTHWAFFATTANKPPYWKKMNGKEIMTQQEKEPSKRGTGDRTITNKVEN